MVAVLAIVASLLVGVAVAVCFSLLLKAVGEVMQLRKEKVELQAELVKHRRWLADAEDVREDRRKDLANARALLDVMEKEKDARIAELEAANDRLDKLCEFNRKGWLDARNRCTVLEAELAEWKDAVSLLNKQMARQCEEEKALREAHARQERDWRESLQIEADRTKRVEAMLKVAREEAGGAVGRLHQAIEDRDRLVLAMKDECQAYARLMTDLKGKLDFASSGMAQAGDAIGRTLEAYNRPLPGEADETA